MFDACYSMGNYEIFYLKLLNFRLLKLSPFSRLSVFYSTSDPEQQVQLIVCYLAGSLWLTRFRLIYPTFLLRYSDHFIICIFLNCAINYRNKSLFSIRARTKTKIKLKKNKQIKFPFFPIQTFIIQFPLILITLHLQFSH